MKLSSLFSSLGIWKGKHVRIWLVLFWLLISAISTTTLYIQLKSGAGASPWWQIFFVKLMVWAFWGANAILISHLARRFRFEGKFYFANILLHFLLSILFSLFNVFLYDAFAHVISLQAFDGVGFVNAFFRLLIGLFEWYFIIYWAIVAVTYVFDYQQKYQQSRINRIQLESQLSQAQLHALKMQLQPHFLFNFLNSVISQIKGENKTSAINMLNGLSDLLRWTLDQKDQQEIPFHRELSFVRQYLELESMRFGKQMKVEWEIPKEAQQAIVPNFLLQPLVENSIKHGISKKISAKLVRISAHIKDDRRLTIKVYNEGPSLPEHFYPELNEGLGLATTLERLNQRYGEEASFEIRNQAEGVEAVIDLPLITHETGD